ncbi:hypothetical protein FDB75_16300 [Clostridium botulinum]|uniref:hypothetical protein n=1 Tax=Clostridium TaxID=1485 RepID=UPI0013C58390|nr:MULTISPECIES: hypothetical protein [Clostridium]MCS6132259.1 hypothetical protein [Clostridium botulinum]NFL45673.1 hypothetical protein [Clostridium botulinum]NFL90570.1 hypothetical protein [Clostridium botulinum]NFN29941.1 hypothetical protein [Clostridium botulinum]NFO50295.1 hypothetical protein [Clostridium botulinum]
MNRYSSKKYGLLSNVDNKETLEAFKLAEVDNIDIYSSKDKSALLNKLNAGDTLLLESLKVFSSVDDIFRFINISSTDININLRCLHEENINFSYDDSIENLLTILRLFSKLENQYIDLLIKNSSEIKNVKSLIKNLRTISSQIIIIIIKNIKFNN